MQLPRVDMTVQGDRQNFLPGTAGTDRRIYSMYPTRAGEEIGDEATGTAAERDETAAGRILIIEDDWFIAMETEAVLTRAGYEIAGMASEQNEALLLAARARPDLVLMDIKLARGSDGIVIARKILDEHGIRCIFVTAHGDRATRQRGETANPHSWLIKPFNNRQLLKAVGDALGKGE